MDLCLQLQCWPACRGAANLCVLCRYAAYTVTPHASRASHKTAAALSTQAVYTYTEGVLTLPSEQQDAEALSDSVTIDNGLLELNFSRSTGKLHSIQNRQAGVTENVTLDMAAYLSGEIPAILCSICCIPLFPFLCSMCRRLHAFGMSCCCNTVLVSE